MKNVLFLLDYFCENASANGICCRNVAKEMTSRGYRVFVGSYRPESAPDVEQMEDVQVYKTWTMPATQVPRTLKDRLRFYAKWIFPSRNAPAAEEPDRTAAIYGAARKIIAAEQIDTVICVHLPVEALIAGTLLKADYPNISVCGYMLDSMSGGVLPRFLPARYARQRKIKWEANLLEKLDLAVLMESARTHHQTFTPTQAWMSHGVFGDIPQMTQLAHHGSVYHGEDTISIVYVGSLMDGLRTPYHFLKVLSCVSNYQVELTLAGNHHCEMGFEEFVRANPKIKLRLPGAVSHASAMEWMNSAHILVNFGNRNSTLVPSKIFEYMSLGKPIISTCCGQNDSSGAYLAKYPYVLWLDEENKDYLSQARALEAFVASISGVRIDTEEILKAFYQNTPGAFVDLLIHQFD